MFTLTIYSASHSHSDDKLVLTQARSIRRLYVLGTYIHNRMMYKHINVVLLGLCPTVMMMLIMYLSPYQSSTSYRHNVSIQSDGIPFSKLNGYVKRKWCYLLPLTGVGGGLHTAQLFKTFQIDLYGQTNSTC